MAVLISSARIDQLQITRTDEAVKLEGTISLMKEDGMILAKQSINGYGGDIKLEFTGETAKLVRALSDHVKREIENIIGITEST